MAVPAPAKFPEAVPFFDNNSGVNAISSPFDGDPAQARTARDIIFSKKGGFKARGGQVAVNATQPSGNPEYLRAIVFRRTSGGTTTTKKVAVGSDGKIYDFSTDPPTAVLTGLTTTGWSPDFAVANGWLLYCDGVNTPRKWDMTNWRNWGITSPASAPTLAAGGAGNPNGTYRFRVSFLRNASGIDPGHESSMGTISVPITVANLQINLTAVPTSADAQVNARNIYVEIQGQWYLASSSEPSINDNTTTTFTYTLLDSEAVLNKLGRTDRDPPSTASKICESHKGIIFVTDGRFLDWTAFQEFESFAPNIVTGRRSGAFEPDDGTSITCLRSLTDLIVGKTKSIFIRSGDDITYSIEKKINDSGIISRDAVAVDKTLHYFAPDGFRTFDGSETKLICRNIQPLLFGSSAEKILDTTQMTRVTGAAYANIFVDTVAWSIPTATGVSARILLYFKDYPTKDPLGETVGAWVEWTNMDARFLFKETDVTTFQDKLFAAGKDGFMRQLDSGFSDPSGVTIQPRYRQMDIVAHKESPVASSRLRDAWFYINALDVGSVNAKVKWWVNGFDSGVQTSLLFEGPIISGGVFDVSSFDAAYFAGEGDQIGLAGYGPNPFHFIAPELTWTVTSADTDILIHGWVLRFLDAGHRRPTGAA